MVDRIDIFENEGVAEPESPEFLGVEQTKLGLQDYSNNFVNFFNQYYGMDSLGKGLEDTGIGVDEPEDITELATPQIRDEGGEDKDIGTFESSFPGADLSGISYDYSGGDNPYNSYSDALKGQNVMTDRVPMMENLFEPLLSKDRFGEYNFDDIDLSEAFMGEYEAAKTTVAEAPGKLGDILKGKITDKQKRGLVAGLFTQAAPLFGGVIGSIINGEQMQNAFGKTSTRPSGPLGIAFDINQTVQFNDMANIRAAHAANASLQQSFDKGALPDELTTGAFSQATAPTGFAMRHAGVNFGVTRSPGSIHYNGNTRGMSRSQLEALDALSKGLIPKGFDVRTERGTTIADAGWLATGSTGRDGALGKGQGFYTDTGSFYSPGSNSYSAYGLESSAIAAAAKAGVSVSEFKSALSDARNGKGKLSDLVNTIKQDNLNKAEADRIAEAKAKEAARDYKDKAQIDAYVASSTGRDDDFGGFDDVSPTGEAEDEGDFAFKSGGKVGYAMGTPPPGVQAQPSGFIDAPPSQVAEGQKVADNRDMEVKEGTFIINAAAVEFAGEQDIRKMLMDAQKEAVRRGVVQGNGERASELIDIAVSSGEVTVAPHLVKIIGEDRLEKINNRGLRKTEQRIQRAEAQRPQADRPVPVSRGGFLYHAGGGVHSHDRAAIDPSVLGGRDSSEYGASMTQETYEETFASPLKAQHQRKSLTPKFASQAEEKAYRQGVEFGDREVFADILGKTNYNALIQAAARDTRTLSDTVTTLRPKERIKYPYANNPLGLYSGRGLREYRPTLLQHPYYGDDKVSSSERYDRYRAANEPRITDSSIIMRSPTEFGGTAQSSRFSGSYNATLAHELMHKGADILLNIPEYSAGTVLQDIFKGLEEASDAGSLLEERRGAQSAEHRYIVGVVGQAYMKSEIESALGTFEKSQRAPEGFEGSFRKLSDSDRGNEIKRIFSKEMDRVYKLYLTPDQKQQLILENPTVLAPFSTDPEKSTGYYFGKGERSSESYIGLKDDIENIPLEDVAKAYQSLNRLMTEDYATQLFERAVVKEPYVTPRIESDNKPYVPRRETSEPEYERGFLDKMLGVTPAY